jgi:hypothetical protein
MQQTDSSFIAGNQTGRLQGIVAHLASVIGPRNIYHYPALAAAASYIEQCFTAMGHAPVLLPYETRRKAFVNIVAEVRGSTHPEEIVIVGAHYDTHKDSPGANDNGTAVAGMLELARHYASRQAARTLRFAGFTNEEKPFTHRKDMGSRVYARGCRERGERIAGMICLETTHPRIPLTRSPGTDSTRPSTPSSSRSRRRRIRPWRHGPPSDQCLAAAQRCSGSAAGNARGTRLRRGRDRLHEQRQRRLQVLGPGGCSLEMAHSYDDEVM